MRANFVGGAAWASILIVMVSSYQEGNWLSVIWQGCFLAAGTYQMIRLEVQS